GCALGRRKIGLRGTPPGEALRLPGLRLETHLLQGLRLPGMPASGRAVSTVGLFGALGALTGASTVLALGLHVLTRAERARNHDEQAAATGPKPLMQVRPKQVRPKQVRPKQVRPKQVPPMQAKEEEWSASPAGPCSPSVPSLPQRPPMGSPLVSHTAAVDADGLR